LKPKTRTLFFHSEKQEKAFPRIKNENGKLGLEIEDLPHVSDEMTNPSSDRAV
jgi:hypothetical protein